MNGLGRINLLVGNNNSGKTSILECIALLRSAGDPDVLSSMLHRRGEFAYSRDNSGRTFLNPRHLFAHHSLTGTIDLTAERLEGAEFPRWNDRLKICMEDRAYEKQPDFTDEEDSYFLKIDSGIVEEGYRIAVTPEGLLPVPRARMFKQGRPEHPIQFVRTSGMTARDVVQQFSDIVLTGHETHVTEALQIIEPAIERIATLADGPRSDLDQGPGGVVLRLRQAAERIPIGSAGDGMWRMLGLALSIANARGGIVLVDEIDTGLHYSIMEDMWRMISERASDLAVQVFATTHSRDCYESLAAIVQAGATAQAVTIQRIAADQQSATRCSNQDIMAATERGIEVR